MANGNGAGPDPEDPDRLPEERLQVISQVAQAVGSGRINRDSARSYLQSSREEELLDNVLASMTDRQRDLLEGADVALPGEQDATTDTQEAAPDEQEAPEEDIGAGLSEFSATPDTAVRDFDELEQEDTPTTGPDERAPGPDQEAELGAGLSDFSATPDTARDLVEEEDERPWWEESWDWIREQVGSGMERLQEQLDSPQMRRRPAAGPGQMEHLERRMEGGELSPERQEELRQQQAREDRARPSDEAITNEVLEQYRRAREEGPDYEPGGIFEDAEIEAWRRRIREPDTASGEFIRQGIMDEAAPWGPEDGRGEPPERDRNVVDYAFQGTDVGSDVFKRAFGSLSETLGRMTGDESILQMGERTQQEVTAEREQERAEGITTPSITEAFDSPEKFAEYVSYAASQGVTTSSPMIGGGLLAGALGGGTAAIGSAVALPAYAIAHGEVRQALDEAGMPDGTKKEALIAAGALPIAALELAMEAGVATRTFGRAARRQAVDNLVDFAKQWIRSSVRTGTEEAATESLQTLAKQGVVAASTGREFLTSELGREMIEAGPAGFFGGAPFGTVDAASQVDPVRLREANRAIRRTLASRISPELAAEAEEDPVTGLDNRNGMNRKADRREPAPDTERVEIHGDIDNMKYINNFLGHDHGDRALQVVADALRGVTRGDDVVSIARTGGDEFVVTMDIPEGQNPGPIIQRIEERSNQALQQYGPEESDRTYAEPEEGYEVGISWGLGDEGMYQRKEERGVSESEVGVTEAEEEEAGAGPEPEPDETADVEGPAEEPEAGTEEEEVVDRGPFVTDYEGGRVQWGDTREWLHGLRELLQNDPSNAELGSHLSNLAENADLVRQTTDRQVLRDIRDFARGNPHLDGAEQLREVAETRMDETRPEEPEPEQTEEEAPPEATPETEGELDPPADRLVIEEYESQKSTGGTVTSYRIVDPETGEWYGNKPSLEEARNRLDSVLRGNQEPLNDPLGQRAQTREESPGEVVYEWNREEATRAGEEGTEETAPETAEEAGVPAERLETFENLARENTPAELHGKLARRLTSQPANIRLRAQHVRNQLAAAVNEARQGRDPESTFKAAVSDLRGARQIAEEDAEAGALREQDKEALEEAEDALRWARRAIDAAPAAEGETLPAPVEETTPGTRVSYSNLEGWVQGLQEIEGRRTSSQQQRQIENHLQHLVENPELIQEEVSQVWLRRARSALQDYIPPRGRRADHPTTRAREMLNNRLEQLRQGAMQDVEEELPTTEQEAEEVTEGPLDTIHVKVPLSELSDQDLERVIQNVARRQAPGWESDLAKLRQEVEARNETVALPEPEGPTPPLMEGTETTGARGAETELRPVSGGPIQAQYKAIPISEAVPSHNPFSFDKNSLYPEALQPRSYHAVRAAQEAIMEVARQWDPDIYLDLTQLPVSGPSQVSPTGIVLGGNNRVMSAKRVYEMDEDAAAEFKQAQVEAAERFGLDPEAVRQMEQPIIVREVTDADILTMDEEQLADLGARLNEDPQKASDPLDEAVTLAVRLENPDAEDAMDHFLETVDPDETLRAYMGRADGRKFMEQLVKLNVVPHQESGQYFTDDGSVASNAKDLVERMFRASVIQDRDLLATAPPSELRKIEKAVPAILKAAQVEGYDVRPEIQEAMRLLRQVRNSDEENVQAFLQQMTMLEEDWSALGVAMAEYLERNTRNPVSEGFRAFAADAVRTRDARLEREAGQLFDDPPPLPDPAEKFRQRFVNEDYSQPEVDVPGLTGDPHRTEYQSHYERTGEDPRAYQDPFESEGLDVETHQGREGDTSHITRVEKGRIPTEALWPWEGARGEQRGQHRKRKGEEWEEFLAHVKEKGIQQPIFVTVDPGQEPKINEGNHRLDAAHELGLESVPVEIRYFGKAGETGGTVLSRARMRIPGGLEGPRAGMTMGQGDMFRGSDAPAEGGEQFDMFSGQNDEYTKQNLSEAERQAAETVRELGPAVDNGSASEEELSRFNEARKLLRRSEKFTADEIQLIMRENAEEGPPQAEGQQDMFGGPTTSYNVRRGSAMDPATRDYWVQRLSHQEQMRDPADFPDYTEEDVGTEGEDEGLLSRLPAGFRGQKYIPSRQEIIDDIAKALRVPITTDKAKFGRAFGFYKVTPQSIKMKWAQDFQTASHEIGHHMHWILFDEDGLTEAGRLSNEILKPWEDELAPLAQSVSDETLTEGEAEFFRLYLTSDKGWKAKERAPEFFRFVEGYLEETEPVVLRALKQARKRYSTYRNQSAEGHFLSGVVNAGADPMIDFGDKVRNTIRQLAQDLFDYKKPFEWMEEELFGEGGPQQRDIPFEKHVSAMAQAQHGSESRAIRFLKHGAFDFNTREKVGPPLVEILAPVQDEMDDFTAYALAMRSRERRSRGYETGFRKEAENAVIEKHGGKEHFRQALEGIQQWREHMLQYLVDGGVMSQKSMNAILEKSNYYVPLYSAAEQSIREGIGRGGGGVANIRQAVYHYRGSSVLRLHPIDALVQDAFLFTDLVARQQTAMALVRASQERGAGWMMEKVAQPQRATNVSVAEALQGIQEAIGKRTKDISADDLMGALEGEGPGDQFVGETREAAEALEEATGELLEELPADVLEEMFMILRPGDYHHSDDAFSVRMEDENGDMKRYWFQVHDQQLWDALQGRDSWGSPEDVLGKVRHLFGLWEAPARVLRIGATASPIFALARNPQRDIPTSFLQSEFGVSFPAIPLDHMKGIAQLIGKGEAYERLLSGGGKFAEIVSMDRSEISRQAGKFAQQGGTITGVIRDIPHLLRDMSALWENMSRMAEFTSAYETLIEEGRSRREAEIRAGVAARDVTTDFANHGLKTRFLRGMSTFWNAMVVSYERMYRVFKNHPYRTTARAVAAITIPELILFSLNYDNEDYWELPEWLRATFWHIPIPRELAHTADYIVPDSIADLVSYEQGEGAGSAIASRFDQGEDYYFLRIARPHIYGQIFGYGPLKVLEALFRDDPQGTGAALRDFGAEVGGRNLLEWAPIPQMHETLLLAIAGFDTWQMRNVVPQGLQGVDPREQYTPTTSPTAKMLADFLSEGVPGMEFSPIKMEAMVSGQFGSVGRGVLQTADAVQDATGIADRGYTGRGKMSTPWVGGLFDEPYAYQPQSVSDLYGEWQRIRQTYRTWRQHQERNNYEEAAEYREEHTADMQLYYEVQPTIDLLRFWRDQVERIQSGEAPEWGDEEALERLRFRDVQEYHRRMAEIARNKLERIHTVREQTGGGG